MQMRNGFLSAGGGSCSVGSFSEGFSNSKTAVPVEVVSLAAGSVRCRDIGYGLYWFNIRVVSGGSDGDA